MLSLSTTAPGVLKIAGGFWTKSPMARASLPLNECFPVSTETVKERWVDVTTRGDRKCGPVYVAVALRPVLGGASVVNSNCGFAIRHRSAVCRRLHTGLAAAATSRRCPAAIKGPMRLLRFDAEFSGGAWLFRGLIDALDINAAPATFGQSRRTAPQLRRGHTDYPTVSPQSRAEAPDSAARSTLDPAAACPLRGDFHGRSADLMSGHSKC